MEIIVVLNTCCLILSMSIRTLIWAQVIGHPVFKIFTFTLQAAQIPLSALRSPFVIALWKCDAHVSFFSKLTFWTSNQSNSINGSDGSAFHPFLDKNERIYIFTPDLCRYGAASPFEKVIKTQEICPRPNLVLPIQQLSILTHIWYGHNKHSTAVSERAF